MYELLYRSVAKPDLTTNDISKILQASQKWNLQNDVTGCLLYFDRKFVQIIEGDKRVIKMLFSSIEKDTRHENVTLLAENEKEFRFFKHWSMAFNDLSDLDMDHIDYVLMINNFITFHGLDYRLTEAMKLFCTLTEESFRKLTLPQEQF